MRCGEEVRTFELAFERHIELTFFMREQLSLGGRFLIQRQILMTFCETVHAFKMICSAESAELTAPLNLHPG